MDWDSGKKWNQGIPQGGGMVNKNEVILMNQGACGAFVHGLEDEYMGECYCIPTNIFKGCKFHGILIIP